MRPTVRTEISEFAEQTPDAKLPRIRMALLEVIDFQHEWQPDFPGGSLGGEALVTSPRSAPLQSAESTDRWSGGRRGRPD